MKKTKKAFIAEKIVTLSPAAERELLKIAKEKVKIVASGDSNYSVGDIIDLQQAEKVNKSLVAEQKTPAQFQSFTKSHKIERDRTRAIRLLIYHNQHLVKYIARHYFSANVGVDYE